MIVKILGFFDFVVIFCILFSEILPFTYLIKASLYLLVKGGIFSLTGDFASYLDVICGIYILFFAFGLSINLFTAIVVLYLGQKCLVSFIF